MFHAKSFDILLYVLAAIVIIFFLIAMLVGIYNYFNDFSKQHKYLTGEIKRTHGSERRHYIRRRRRLWLSLIPFVKRR